MLNIKTGCAALDWVASKTQDAGPESFEQESWNRFVFVGKLNSKMVRAIKAFAGDIHTEFHSGHFILTLDGIRYEFDCRMPSVHKADYDKCHFLISVYN